MSRILVLGARGAVGRHIVARLTERGHTPIRAGRSPENDVVVDAAGPLDALRDADALINASGIEDARLARLGMPLYEISATTGYLRGITAGDAVLGVGLAPGLSTLMAAALPAGPIDVALVLGAGEKHGAAAVAWTVGLLGASFDSAGERVRNFTRPRRIGGTTFVRADFPDALLLDRPELRNYLALTSPAATLALRAATWLPPLRPLVAAVHPPGSDAWSLRVENRRTGDWLAAEGRNQSRATAALAVAAVELAVPVGIRTLPELSTLDAVAAAAGIPLHSGRVKESTTR